MKIVNSLTEEIYNFQEYNKITGIWTVEYQKDNFAIPQIQVLPAAMFIIHNNIFVDFEGYEFKNWLHEDWPTRIKLTHKQITDLLNDYPEFLTVMKSDPENPNYEWESKGKIIYAGKTIPISEAERNLITIVYGGIIEDMPVQ